MRNFIKSVAGIFAGIAILLAGSTSFADWILLGDSEYKNLMSLDSYVAALEDTTDRNVEFGNLMTMEKYIAAINDHRFSETEYANIMTLERYVANLGHDVQDFGQVAFDNAITLERYIANLADRCFADESTPATFVLAQCEIR